MEDGEGSRVVLPLEMNGRERSLLHFLQDGRLWHNRDAMIDLYRAFHRFDIVELHDRFDLELVVAKDLIDRLASRDVWIEANETLRRELLHFQFAAFGERMTRMRDQHEVIVAERQHLDLTLLHRESDETK